MVAGAQITDITARGRQSLQNIHGGKSAEYYDVYSFYWWFDRRNLDHSSLVRVQQTSQLFQLVFIQQTPFTQEQPGPEDYLEVF